MCSLFQRVKKLTDIHETWYGLHDKMTMLSIYVCPHVQVLELLTDFHEMRNWRVSIVAIFKFLN